MIWQRYLDTAHATLASAGRLLSEGDVDGAAAALEELGAPPDLPPLPVDLAARARALYVDMAGTQRAVVEQLTELRRELAVLEDRGNVEPVPLFLDRTL